MRSHGQEELRSHGNLTAELRKKSSRIDNNLETGITGWMICLVWWFSLIGGLVWVIGWLARLPRFQISILRLYADGGVAWNGPMVQKTQA